MSKAQRQVPLPYTILNEVAILDGFLGPAGPAPPYPARLKNIPPPPCEMMVARESDPHFFGLAYEVTIGKGAIEDATVVKQIRDRAGQLWREFASTAAAHPDQALKLREQYLRVVDPRLLENPGLVVKVPAHQGAASKDTDRLLSEDRAL